MNDIIVYFLRGFFSLIRYLPAFIISVTFQVITLRKRLSFKHMIINALFVLYIFALLDIIGIFEMKPSINRLLSGRYVKPNLVPFLNMVIKQGVLNLILLMPMGIFIQRVIEQKNACLLTAAVCFTVSMMIEMCQLLGGRSFDIDDVIMNVAGGCAGYVFSKKWHLLLVKKLSQRNSDGVI